MQSKWLLLCATPLLLPAALDRLPGGAGEAVRMGLLAEPATALASFFCSGPLTRDTLTGWPLLPGWAGTVRVTPDCAGLQFWCIALAVALFHLLPGRAGVARLRAAAAAVLAAYALTLLLNASRILLVGVCQPFAQSWPDVLAGTLHLGVGVLVFLPGLMGFSWLLTRFRALEVERPRETGGISGRGVGESREDPRPPSHYKEIGPEAPAESPTPPMNSSPFTEVGSEAPAEPPTPPMNSSLFTDVGPEAPAEPPPPPGNSSLRTKFDSNSPRDSEESAGASGPKTWTCFSPNSPRDSQDSAGASGPKNWTCFSPNSPRASEDSAGASRPTIPFPHLHPEPHHEFHPS